MSEENALEVKEEQKITERMHAFRDAWNNSDSIEELCEKLSMQRNSARTVCYRLRKKGYKLKPLNTANAQKKKASRKSPHFASNLSLLMALLGTSDASLGKRLGVTRDVIGQWRRGRHEPSIGQLFELARVLKVSTDVLLQEGAVTPQIGTQLSLPFDG